MSQTQLDDIESEMNEALSSMEEDGSEPSTSTLAQTEIENEDFGLANDCGSLSKAISIASLKYIIADCGGEKWWKKKKTDPIHRKCYSLSHNNKKRKAKKKKLGCGTKKQKKLVKKTTKKPAKQTRTYPLQLRFKNIDAFYDAVRTYQYKMCKLGPVGAGVLMPISDEEREAKMKRCFERSETAVFNYDEKSGKCYSFKGCDD